MSFIDNIYYRFYRLLISIGEEDTPRYNAVLIISMLFMLNFLTLTIIVGCMVDKIIIVNSKIYLLAIGLIIIGLTSYIIFRRKHYLHIENRYMGESKREKMANNLKVVVYTLSSILIFILSLKYSANNPISKFK